MDEQYEKHLENIPKEEQERMVEEGFWPSVAQAGAKLPFVRDAVASYYCLIDDRVSKTIRAGVVLPLAYFVMPLDAIPDFIVALGYTDDAAVIYGALKIFGSSITEEHYENADKALGIEPNA